MNSFKPFDLKRFDNKYKVKPIVENLNNIYKRVVKNCYPFLVVTHISA